MELEVRKYEKYKRDLEFMLVSSGLWPTFHKHPRYLRMFLSFWSVIVNGLITCGIVSFCIHHISNIQILTRGLGMMMSFSTAFLKVCTLRLHQKELQSLNEGISAKFEDDLAVPEYRPYLLAHCSTYSRFFYTLSYCLVVSILLLLVAPLTMLRHGKYIRLFPLLLPFNYEPGGMIHWIISSFEIMGAFYIWTITAGTDSVLGLYSMHMVGELRLLSARFQSLRSSSNYRKNLKDCVDRHHLLIESQVMLQRVFGFLAIMIALTSAVIICSVTFQVTQAKQVTAFKVAFFIFYYFLKLVQAYSYAWYGNIITVESELCLNSIYNAAWPGSGDMRFMSDVLTILTQKPLIFIAKGCMFLRLDMFSKIVHTSVSYYFLLITLDENLA